MRLKSKALPQPAFLGKKQKILQSILNFYLDTVVIRWLKSKLKFEERKLKFDWIDFIR